MSRGRILYTCPYVPYGWLRDQGFTMVSAYEEVHGSGGRLPRLLHSCSYTSHCAKLDYERYDGAILVNCCNGMQRLRDALQVAYPNLWLSMLEIPSMLHYEERQRYSEQLEELRKQLNHKFSVSIPEIRKKEIRHIQRYETFEPSTILIIGNGISKGYAHDLNNLFPGFRLRFSCCSSIGRGDALLNRSSKISVKEEEVSCPRMANFIPWLEVNLHNQSEAIRGVILISAGRCDYTLFSYPQIQRICSQNQCKVLQIEEEMTVRISERSRIRYEAFRENLQYGKGGVL